MFGLGTIVNTVGIILGGLVGLIFKKGLKPRFQSILTDAIGLAVIFMGASGALAGMLQITKNGLETAGTMMIIFSLVLGAVVGEAINLDYRLEQFGSWLKKKFSKKADPLFVEGFVTASCTVCIGAMAIVGSLEDGLTGDASMLYAKTVLDAIIIMVYVSSFGKGAIFSAIPVFLLQGSVTIFAALIAPLMTETAIANLSMTGSMLIFCIGTNLLFHTKIKVANLLPALIFVIIYGLLF
ncbi:MAG: DUF554 domain-containing protein [bacterium]|nr:DUF554 domain-containing protein [bacterium]